MFVLSNSLYFFNVSQTSSTRLTPTFPQVKRRRPGWPTPSLSQTSSTRLTHTFPQSNVVDPVDPHLTSVKCRRPGWPTHSRSQTSSTRLTHTFPQSNVVDSVDPHLPSVKRRRPGWPTPSLSQTSSTRWNTPSLSQTSSTQLTHTFPQSNVIDSVDPHLPSFPCNFILNLFSFWILINKRYIIPRGNKNGHTRRIKQKNTTT